MAADGRLHRAVVFPQMAADYRLVHPQKRMYPNLISQPLMSPIVFRYNEQAAGILVNAVDDPGPQNAIDPRQGCFRNARAGR